MRRPIFAIVCVLLAGAIFFAGPGHKKRLFKESRTSLYTLVSISVVAGSEDKARGAIAEAYRELDRLGQLLNFYADDSELSAINRNAGIKPVRGSADTLDIIRTAVYAGEQTEGGFDVTVGPIVRLWDFKKKKVPTPELIEKAKDLVGYKHIIVDSAASTVFLDKKGMQIDLGGILKGYAADKAVDVLMQKGIDDGIVAVAGDIRVFGHQPDGKPWNIGIQNPRQTGENDALLATVHLENGGISTSGDYQRYFIEKGVRYHHLLNPLTGYPQSLCRSVTIVAPTSALTDSFATGIFILGPTKGIAVLEKLGLDGLIVDKDGGIRMTKGLKDKVQLIGDH
jgi:thiamine biosynthesis lipoprotein